MSIIVLCPTRGRGFKAVNATNNSFYDTKTLDTTRLVFIVDRDDASWDNDSEYDHDVVYYARKTLPRNIVAATNEAWEYYKDDADIFGFIGDDNRFRSTGWDEKFESALGNGGVGYGDDGVHGPNLPTSWWVTSDILRRLGWFCNPALRHFFLDNTWLELGKSTNSLHYIPDVLIEHLHFSFGKSELDNTWHTMEVGAGDDARFKNWLTSSEFDKNVNHILRALGERSGIVYTT